MLYLAFIWHMHQPYYRDVLTGEVNLPWVRLHGIKDYLDMVRILDGFPDIHQTFNITCSLIDQLCEAGSGTKNIDKFFELSQKKAQDLNDEEKDFILLNFFSANFENIIKPHPQYHNLFLKRGMEIVPQQISRPRKRFSAQDLLDLQVWFNLAWFDPSFKENIPELKELIKKGKNFTEEEKKIVLDKQLSLLKQIIPTYKRFQETGQIEITTSPYYHPILPLIYNANNNALESMPGVKLPSQKVNFPDDARWQISKALERYRDCFNISPRGMWPSEGAVSDDILQLIMEEGIEWLATDEEILLKSLHLPRLAEAIYKPYLLERDNRRLNIIFRDHTLSDRIGFAYQHISTGEAIGDFMGRLYDIRDKLNKKDGLVTVALDGENAWEYYSDDGRDFLKGLYETLSRDKEIKLVTVSEFLKENPPEDKIKKLFSGSWINADFSMWIGSEEKNLAWEYLAKARNRLSSQARVPNPKIDDAWKCLYIAEASDWFWWYGTENSIFNEEFDRLYRKNLSNIYSLLQEEIPDYLRLPIRRIQPVGIIEPAGFIKPSIDGKVSDYYEWLGAGLFDTTKFKASMQQAKMLIRRIFYGFDLENLYLRIDLDLKTEYFKDESIKVIILLLPIEMRLEIFISSFDKEIKSSIFKNQEGKWLKVKQIETISFDKTLELAIGFKELGVKENDNLKLCLLLEKKGILLECHPQFGAISIKIPDRDYQSYMWSV